MKTNVQIVYIVCSAQKLFWLLNGEELLCELCLRTDMIGRVTTNTKETTRCHYCASWPIWQIYCIHVFQGYKQGTLFVKMRKSGHFSIFIYDSDTVPFFLLYPRSIQNGPRVSDIPYDNYFWFKPIWYISLKHVFV